MNTVTHTPLPWKLARSHPNPKTAESYLEIFPETGGATGPHSSLEIAGLYCAEVGSVQEANGKLIVRSVNALPVLVEALDEMLATHELREHNGERITPLQERAMKQARAALQLAKGETP